LEDLRTIVKDPHFFPSKVQDICALLFHTAYMGTENSSSETRERASRLAKRIGSYHLEIPIDTIVAAFIAVLTLVTMRTPVFKVYGIIIDIN
jgi:NAD+ synthase (glutamine-hydrolysing)